ncbi:MAG TPA: hypothetical protein VF157_15345 [Chloroflexota bacterium]
MRWLDVIPGRNWLVFGPDAGWIAEAVRASYKPAGVTVVQAPSTNDVYDVALSAGGPLDSELVARMRRALCPSALAAAYQVNEPANLERLFRAAGLHAVQTCVLQGAAAVKGAR